MQQDVVNAAVFVVGVKTSEVIICLIIWHNVAQTGFNGSWGVPC